MYSQYKLWIIVSLSLFFLLRCPSIPTKESETPVKDLASEEKTPEEIRLKIKSLSTVEVSKYDSGLYPQYFGVDVRNKKRMIVIFYCPRRCKNDPLLFLIYENADENLCIEEKLGQPLYDPVNDFYLGCEPSVN